MQNAQPKPTFAFQWHITDECDQRCKHCYLFADENCTSFERMPWSSMVRVVDQTQDMCEKLNRAPYFYITGGDPILHPDFWRLAQLFHERNIMWCIMGNPFHLNDENCARLKELGCRKYQLSLDGLEQTHDYFRKPGSFKETLRAITCLQKAGVWVAIMNTVSSTNAAELPALIDLIAGLNVEVFAVGRYCPTQGQQLEEFHLEPLEYRNVLLACQERIEYHESHGAKTYFQLKDHLWTLLRWEQGKFTIPENTQPGMIYDGCHCGTGHMTILPSGDVYACRRMESKVGSLAEDTLYNLFLSANMEEKRSFEKFEKCADCELFGWCRGCPAVSYGYTGNMYSADPQCWKDLPQVKTA